MQDPRMPFSEEIPNLAKPQKKKKPSTQKAVLSTKTKKNDNVAQASSFLPKSSQKASKRGSANEVSPMSHHHQPERSNSDSLPESCSGSGNEYRLLRRKYLLLEEESFSIGSGLKGVEDEVKTLEDEKIALLDKLVVLEGLVDPSNFHSLSQGKL